MRHGSRLCGRLPILIAVQPRVQSGDGTDAYRIPENGDRTVRKFFGATSKRFAEEMRSPSGLIEARLSQMRRGIAAKRFSRYAIVGLIAFAVINLFPRHVRAVPSFARQTGLSCTACHTEFPILTEYGRNFKLSGYTMSAEDSMFPPLAVMIQPSFTATNADQSGGAAPHFGPNANLAV